MKMNTKRKTLKMPVRYLMNTVLVALLFLGLSYLTGNLLSTYQNKVLMTVGINIILAVSLNVATGYLGQLPLGHAGFMAVGAYTCALFTKYSSLPSGAAFAIGLALGTYLNFLLVAKRLRIYSAEINAITVPEFFSKRFKDDKKVLLGISALIILIFFIPYTASGFKAVGTLFNSLFGFEYHTAMIIGAVVIIAYTVMGGFLAVSTTDLVQSIFMTVALIVVVCFGVGQAGGVDAVLENARSLPGYLNLTQGYDAATNQAGSFPALSIVSTLAWGLGYFGMPHILLRFMAIEDEKKLVVSRRVGSVWVVIAMFLAVMIGVVGNTLTASGTIQSLSGSASETIVIQIATLLSKAGILPALMAGLILAGILASTMSTADSQLLAASSSVSQNLLQDTLGLKLSQKSSMLAARLTVVLIAILGVIIAQDPNSSIFGIVSFAWAGFGAGFGPLVICSLYWKRTTFPGAIAGLVSGGVFVFIWKYLIKPLGGIWGIYELLPAFLVGLIAIVAVSLLTKAPSEEVVKEFELARSNEELK